MPGLTSPRPQQQQQCAPDKQSWPLDLPAVTELSLSQMCFDVNRSTLPTSEDFMTACYPSKSRTLT